MILFLSFFLVHLQLFFQRFFMTLSVFIILQQQKMYVHTCDIMRRWANIFPKFYGTHFFQSTFIVNSTFDILYLWLRVCFTSFAADLKQNNKNYEWRRQQRVLKRRTHFTTMNSLVQYNNRLEIRYRCEWFFFCLFLVISLLLLLMWLLLKSGKQAHTS